MRLGLERVESLLNRLGAPHKRLRVVHIAGSNGKGSVCALVTEGLRAAGHRVGSTISPHLQQVNERIQVDGQPISDESLDLLLEEVVAASGEDFPTYFELITVAAMLHFDRVGVDYAVVEVGLGGRLDATNVVPRPLLTAITTVSLDHMDRLGNDLASIASEKAGIIKPGVPCVAGRLPREAMSVVRSMAAERDSQLLVPDEDYRAHGGNADFTYERGRRLLESLELGLQGEHQVGNAGVAITLLQLLGVGDAAIREAMKDARHPGRLEWLGPRLLVDGAHNTESAEKLAEYLRSLPRQGLRTLVLGVSSDKDIRSLAAPLVPQVDRILTSRCAHARAREPGDVAAELVDLPIPVMPAGNIEGALVAARGGEGLVVVAGSLFLAGAVRDLVEA